MSSAAEESADGAQAADAGGGGAASKPAKPAGKGAGCLTAMTPATTPGCAGCLSAVFLVTTVATVWTYFLLDESNVPWRHSMSPLRIGFVVLMVLLIPLIVRKTVQLWLDTESAKFPDVDYAWKAGLEALAANGISLSSAPVFVILGSSGERQERALLDDPALKLRVAGVPEGPAPLHWYAGKEAIYLFCTDTSWTSALASLREELLAEARSRGQTVPESPIVVPSVSPDALRAAAMPAMGSMALGATAAAAPPPAPSRATPLPPAAGSGAIGGTMMLDVSMMNDLVARAGSTASPSAVPPSAAPPLPNMPYDPNGPWATPPGATSAPAPLPQVPSISETAYIPTNLSVDETTALGGIEPVQVDPQYSATCLKQLQYVGGLLRRARAPVCPLNGVLALLQFESIHGTAAEIEELRQAVRADLATLQFATQVRAPTTALVVGLEKERGFRELVRRVGKDRAAAQRFGRKFDLRAYPTKEQLVSLAAHVCGAFEDWSYALFREENALTRPGNTRLYELLSKVRCGWKDRLAALLADSFGCDATKNGKRDSLLFSGCYLSATGESSDRRAFSRGVIDKLVDEQELVEWNSDAAASNRRQSMWAVIGMLTFFFLTATLAVMFFLGRFRS